MAGDGGRSAGAIGSLDRDQSEPGVRTRVPGIGVHGRGERRGRRLAAPRAAGEHPPRTRRPPATSARHLTATTTRGRGAALDRPGRREQPRNGGGLLADLGDRGALPQLTLPYGTYTQHAGHDIAARVEEPALVIGPNADSARMQ